jgi:hypothetical protein
MHIPNHPVLLAYPRRGCPQISLPGQTIIITNNVDVIKVTVLVVFPLRYASRQGSSTVAYDVLLGKETPIAVHTKEMTLDPRNSMRWDTFRKPISPVQVQ